MSLFRCLYYKVRRHWLQKYGKTLYHTDHVNCQCNLCQNHFRWTTPWWIPPIFLQYQIRQWLTLSSYQEKIKSKSWLHGRKCLERERNKQHAFYSMSKIQSKGTVIKPKHFLVKFLIFWNIILEIQYFKTRIVPLIVWL